MTSESLPPSPDPFIVEGYREKEPCMQRPQTPHPLIGFFRAQLNAQRGVYTQLLAALCIFLWMPSQQAQADNKPFKRIGLNCQRLSQLWKMARYKRLESEDLGNLDWHHLEVLRNGIYARHYMPFRPARMRYFFMDKKQFPWYRPWKRWNEHRVSRMEWDNAALISSKEREQGAIDKRYRLKKRYRLRYFCTRQVSAQDDADPQWDRFKPTPFPVHVHCQEIDQQIQYWSRKYVTSSDLRTLKRKGWLHLSLLRNGLFATQGRSFQTNWLTRFYRRFPWYKKRQKLRTVAAAIRYNANKLFALEQQIGSMRLSLKQYNLDVRCAGAARPEALTLRQKAVLMALSFLGTSRFSYNRKVRKLQHKVAGRADALTARRVADRYDCSGLVESVFQGLDINLAKPAPRRQARYWNTNGVKIILYNLKYRYNVTCEKRTPKPGDLVFFDYCWDANENGTTRDDPLTHIGIVTGVYPDGTVEFVHNAGSGWRRRIEIGRLNLKMPYSKAHNKPYPMCGGMVPAKVFRCYAFPKEEPSQNIARASDDNNDTSNDDDSPKMSQEKPRRYASRRYSREDMSVRSAKMPRRKPRNKKKNKRSKRYLRRKKKLQRKKKKRRNPKRTPWAPPPPSDLNGFIDEHDPL